MSEQSGELPRVAGERHIHSMKNVLSAQSRVGNVLALGLMISLGLGALTWYYINALMRQDRAKAVVQSKAAERAQNDLPLPGIGRVEPPLSSAVFAPAALPEPPDQPPLASRILTEIPVSQNPPAAVGVPPPKTAAQLALERKLSGAVYAVHGAAGGGEPAFGAGAAINPGAGTNPGAAAIPGTGAGPPGTPSAAGDLAALLHTGVTPAARAGVLPAQRLLLPKGAFIDCTLETAIDSTLPGMTTCVTATDTFGVDGEVVLLERGTKLIGETRGQVQQGAARVFVLWTEARTPAGVVVPLDSPGADELGRSGLPGEVNRHFWQRFGAALLISVVDGAIQAAAQSSRGGSTVVLSPSASQDVLTEILKSTLSVPPTVLKRNGDRIQVLVARDVDFRSVYELRSASSR